MPNKHGMQVAMPVYDKSNREKSGIHGPLESYPPSNSTKDRVTGKSSDAGNLRWVQDKLW